MLGFFRRCFLLILLAIGLRFGLERRSDLMGSKLERFLAARRRIAQKYGEVQRTARTIETEFNLDVQDLLGLKPKKRRQR